MMNKTYVTHHKKRPSLVQMGIMSLVCKLDARAYRNNFSRDKVP